MSRSAPDEERGYVDYDPTDREDEHHALLPSTTQELKESPAPQPQRRQCCKPKRPLKPFLVPLVSFLAGGSAVLLVQLLRANCLFPLKPSTTTPYPYASRPNTLTAVNGEDGFAPPYIGSKEIHNYPPTSPTNDFPSLFPTEVGFPGPIGTGAEAALVQTAPVYPKQSGAPLLVPPRPNSKDKSTDEGGVGGGDFDMFKSWGNLSPWYSVDQGAFGVSGGPETPRGCTVEGVHILHRHGARYPTEYTGFASPSGFAAKLHKANQGKKGKVKAKGDLEFLNTWTYKMGHNLLTPFGRQQLFDLGVSMRLKYGFLLESFTDPESPIAPRLPIIRTESQDRMLASATNFALGFFGWPLDGKVLMEVTVEEKGVNNTLAPYKTCTNDSKKGDRGTWYVRKWVQVYLKNARERLGALLEGIKLDYEDVYVMQLLCAYETVSLGYSSFCSLFTQAEWEGFEYALDLYFYYGYGPGAPTARALGSGYITELLARLTHTPIKEHRTSTNATLDDNPITFPLDQKFYVDATHEVVVVNVLTALNLNALWGGGKLTPYEMNKGRKFITSRIAPFATNVQFQLLSCGAHENPLLRTGTQLRIILNDAPVSFSGVRGCPEDTTDGLCAVDTFVKAQEEMLESVDWNWSCYGDWTIPEGDKWETDSGDPPPKPRERLRD